MVDNNNPPKDDPNPTPRNAPANETKDIEIDTEPIVETVKKQVEEAVSKTAAEKAATEATAKVTENIVKQLQGEKEEPKTPWAKEKRTPRDYDEIVDVAKDQTKKEVLEEIDKREKEKTEKAKESEKLSKEKIAQQNKIWDDQIKQLVDEGHIAKPSEQVQEKLDKGTALSEEDMKDQGVQQRRELWEMAKQHNEPNLRLVYFEHMKSKQQPGATAPVFGSSRGSSSEAGEEYSWEEIHKTPMYELIKSREV